MLAETKYLNQPIQASGEMADRIRAFNWAETSLGPLETWPENLVLTVNLLLDSQFPMFLLWGKELIELNNDAYLNILGKTANMKHPGFLGQRAEISWKEVWPTLHPLISQVFETGKSVYLEDKSMSVYRDGHLEEAFFTFSYSPVRGKSSGIEGLLGVCTETTRYVQTLRRQQTLRNIAFNKTGLRTQAQVCAYFTVELQKNPCDVPFAVILIADGITGKLKYAGSTGIPFNKEIISLFIKSPIIREVFSEGHAQTIDNLSDKIVEITCPYWHVPVEKAYVLPLFHSERTAAFGTLIMGISPRKRIDADYIHCMEITAITLSANLTQVSEANKRVISRTANKISKDRLQQIIQQAPVAIAILRDRDFLIESANDIILSLLGQTNDILNKPLADALPALQSQKLLDIVDEVRTSGQSFYGYEEKAVLEQHGQLKERYFNFICQPIKINNDVPGRIMIVATDVTELVVGRKELEEAYEKLHLSKEAAQLGTFDVDIVKGTVEWDERCRALFGIFHNRTVTYEKDFFPALHEEDRERVAKVFNNLYVKSISNGDHDLEYRTVGLEDNKLRWVRAKGKVFFNEQDEPQRFIGSVLEITDKKQDEQRMNDFLGMVSHELKTPLTSLKAHAQILQGKAKQQNDSFAVSTLEKLISQVNKMSTMIHGFLGVSHLESSKIYLNKQDFPLNDLVEEIIAETNAPSHDISIGHFDFCTVHADRDKIGYVLTNLLSNAIKYSPKGHRIEVECKLRDDMVQISVKDEGMGIKSKDINRLFERYYRVTSNHTENISGFGIGLYLCAEIIHGHDGNIWAESESGKGSIFFFNLELAKTNQTFQLCGKEFITL